MINIGLPTGDAYARAIAVQQTTTKLNLLNDHVTRLNRFCLEVKMQNETINNNMLDYQRRYRSLKEQYEVEQEAWLAERVSLESKAKEVIRTLQNLVTAGTTAPLACTFEPFAEKEHCLWTPFVWVICNFYEPGQRSALCFTVSNTFGLFEEVVPQEERKMLIANCRRSLQEVTIQSAESEARWEKEKRALEETRDKLEREKIELK
ncbi:unnamed protein product, partial [Protopolystoma xenopodis]